MWRDRELLRDDIIPYAIKWFTGEAQMEDSDEEDDEDDDEDDEDDVVFCLKLASDVICMCKPLWLSDGTESSVVLGNFILVELKSQLKMASF